MKVFNSGMPDEAYWNSLFNIPEIISWLDIPGYSGPVAEIGCGYGTFTIPAAKETGSIVYAFDIEPDMIETANNNVINARLKNVEFILHDVIENGTGLKNESCGLVLLFNILHFNERKVLLEEASRILKPGGAAAIIHWRKDIPTPRGPEVETRPDREVILHSANGVNLHFNGNEKILEPYHWGIKLIKE
jgi:SAM-dependent methyltransferase